MREQAIQIYGEREFQAEEVANTKALRWEYAWSIQEAGNKVISVVGADEARKREEANHEGSLRSLHFMLSVI